MCLSTAYMESAGQSKKLCEYVCKIETEAGKVLLKDVMGRKLEIKGELKSLDFEKNIIILRESD